MNFWQRYYIRFSLSSYQACLDEVMDMTDLEKLDLAKKALGTMGKFDWPLRETEHITYTFDVVLDQGAYYEVKRHRMMTQTPQELTCSLGYDTPSLIERAGFASEYGFAMDTAAIALRETGSLESDRRWIPGAERFSSASVAYIELP